MTTGALPADCFTAVDPAQIEAARPPRRAAAAERSAPPVAGGRRRALRRPAVLSRGAGRAYCILRGT